MANAYAYSGRDAWRLQPKPDAFRIDNSVAEPIAFQRGPLVDRGKRTQRLEVSPIMGK